MAKITTVVQKEDLIQSPLNDANKVKASDINKIVQTINVNDDLLSEKTKKGGYTGTTQDLKDELNTAVFTGATTYQTEAELLAVSPIPANGTPAKVANDPNSSKNGNYSVVSGAWVQDSSIIDNITVSEDIKTDADKLLFSDRDKELIPDSTEVGSLGYKFIRSDFDFTSIPSGYDNATWEIKDYFDLGGSTINLPANVTLFFNGGSLDNFVSINGDNTEIKTNGDYQLFFNSGSFTGFKNENFKLEWFGARGNGIDADEVSILNAFNSYSKFKANENSTYVLENQLLLPDKTISLDLNGSELKRSLSFSSSESCVVGIVTEGTNKTFIIKNGVLSSNLNQPDFLIDLQGYDKVVISKNTTKSDSPIIRVFECSDAIISNNTYTGLSSTPTINSRFADVKNSDNITFNNNLIQNSKSAFKIEAINSDFNSNIKVVNNTILNTQDTGIFCRMIGTGGNSYKGCIITGNYFKNIGKTAIKFTAPVTATQGDLEKCIITGNIIKGFALIVSSPAIGVFRDDSDTSIFIKEIIVSSNVIDGKDTNGNITTLPTPTDARGVRIQNVDNACINNNIISDIPSEGILMSKITNITCIGNQVKNTNESNVGEASVYLLSVSNGIVNNVCSYAKNGKDGIKLNQVKNTQVFGVYNDNTGYGLNETTDGAIGVKSANNLYTVISKNNSLGDIIIRGSQSSESSLEINSIDSSGSRQYGTSARRDLLSNDWLNNRNVGYRYWNTDNSELEIYTGSSWVKYDGSTVTT